MGSVTVPHEKKWWKDGVVYQVYPASFKDSNNDGIGDIPGIISKLDYIKSLGATIIWLCPHYDSPQVDMGYDISDYEGVYPPYGTVADVDKLIEECHTRGLRLVLDLVVNHTSDQHNWFKESRSSKDNPKRDWYIWRPAKYDSQGNRQPPNNWRSLFGGSVWEWDEGTQEYYLHLFAVQQPDLNWESPAARKAIHESAMDFWLRKGVDGFRVDTVNMYSKHPELPDGPGNGEQFVLTPQYFCNGPHMHKYLGEMNDVLAKYDTMTVGELPFTPDNKKVLKYVSAKAKQLSMVFQFDITDLGRGKVHHYDVKPRSFTLQEFKAALARTQSLVAGNDGWSTAFLENHDQARSISRYASDKPEHRVASGKMLALMLATLTGTLYIYQGQEIGMINAPRAWGIEEYKDIDSMNFYKIMQDRTNSNPAALERAMDALQYLGREHARTPMQWDDSTNGGFSEATPWMRANDSFRTINVKSQIGDENSVLSFWKKMLALRKEHADLFVYGDFELLDPDNGDILVYIKEYLGSKALVVLNFTEHDRAFIVPEQYQRQMTLLVSSAGSKAEALKPFDGRVYLLA